MENFYEDIVKNLKEEANKLSKKITIASNNNEMNLYIASIKSLRDTLDLISKYDWQLTYSEYTLGNDKEIDTLYKELQIVSDKIDIILAVGKDANALKDQEHTLKDLIRTKKTEQGIKQVAVWEQNHDVQIRNLKVWNVVDVLDIATKMTRNAGNMEKH